MEKSIFTDQIWFKIIQSLREMKIKYVLVGGAALAAHGFPRSTLDIDIYVKAEEDTLLKLFTLAKELHLTSNNTDILRFADKPERYKGQWISFSQNSQDILDVFLCETKVFQRLYKNSSLKKDKKTSIRLISLNDLKKLKKQANRPIDNADLEMIKQTEKKKK